MHCPPDVSPLAPPSWASELFGDNIWMHRAATLLAADFTSPGCALALLLGVLLCFAYVAGCTFPLAEMFGGRRATVLMCRRFLAWQGADTSASAPKHSQGKSPATF